MACALQAMTLCFKAYRQSQPARRSKGGSSRCYMLQPRGPEICETNELADIIFGKLGELFVQAVAQKPFHCSCPFAGSPPIRSWRLRTCCFRRQPQSTDPVVDTRLD